MSYTISWNGGRKTTHETYEAAQDAILDAYPEAEIGHDGDLLGGGDRTLAWRNEEESTDDAGARAIAAITFASAGEMPRGWTHSAPWGVCRDHDTDDEQWVSWHVLEKAARKAAALQSATDVGSHYSARNPGSD